VTRSSAQAFSAEVVAERVVVLRGQGGVERPDARRTRDQSGFAARGRPALAVLARLGFLARRRQCLRAVAWPQHVEQNEDEECSAEACREPLRGRPSRLCQRGSVSTSDRRQLRLVSRSPKGELGSRSSPIDHRRVPEPTAIGMAASPGRRLPAQESIAVVVTERRRESRSLRGVGGRQRGPTRAGRGQDLTGRGGDVQNSAPGRTG